MAKGKIVEAQEAIQERNALILQKATLAREMDELKERLVSSKRALVEAEQKKAEKIVAAQAEAVKSYRTSKELNSYILDRLVDEQIHWEENLVKFNPSLEINFDMSGVPPSVSPAADSTVVASPVEETVTTAPEPAAVDVLPAED
ncbi:unnamed protein product [Prunus armeniaca]